MYRTIPFLEHIRILIAYTRGDWWVQAVPRFSFCKVQDDFDGSELLMPVVYKGIVSAQWHLTPGQLFQSQLLSKTRVTL